jgi:hypothetical protein
MPSLKVSFLRASDKVGAPDGFQQLLVLVVDGVPDALLEGLHHNQVVAHLALPGCKETRQVRKHGTKMIATK